MHRVWILRSANRCRLIASVLLVTYVLLCCPLFAQQGTSSDRGSIGAPPPTTSGRGGGANADFDSLIELIQSTVAVDSWAENGGGEGDLLPFEVGGVWVDAAGTLRMASRTAGDKVMDSANESAALDRLRQRPDESHPVIANPHQKSPLRFVSLPRLEQEISQRQAAQQPLDEAMLTLAGIRRVQYVFVFPQLHDLVIAGPADGWHIDAEGRIVSIADDQPIVRLDDLLTLLRRERLSPGSRFGCSITPRQAALQSTQQFLAASSQKPIQRNHRKQWLAELREQLGQQDVDIFGVEATSRVAQVLVAADYHMKLIGMGLEPGVEGVESYLDTLTAADAEKPMSVLRWWFALQYHGLRQNAEGNAYQLIGPGARVLSETELLTEQGKRIHTGESDPLTALFAENFSTHIEALSLKYPLYTELRNVFDLAMLAALLESERLVERAGWQPTLFYNAEQLPLPKANVPQQVDTVVNHRVINRRRFVAGISGGVMVVPSKVLADKEIESDGMLDELQASSRDEENSAQWWWDYRSE